MVNQRCLSQPFKIKIYEESAASAIGFLTSQNERPDQPMLSGISDAGLVE
jgi:hypothetical protein